MWRRLVILLRTFLQYTQAKNFLMTMIPMDTMNPQEDDDEFEKIDVEGDADQPKQAKEKPWRILRFHDEEYVVGKQLREAQGAKDKQKHTHDRILCQHPSEKMLGRGGRNDQKWWCCQACGARWDRILLSKYEPTTSQPSGKDLVTFGKHAGKTYDNVFLNNPGYCDWIMKTAEEGDDAGVQLIKFARYLATREARSPEDVPAGRMDEEL